MKRTGLTALLLAGVLALAACGSKEMPKGTIETAGGASTEAEAPKGAVESAADTADTEDAADTADTEEAADTAAEDEAFEIGDVSGNVYENEFFGIRCNLPEGWTILDEDEIAEVTAAVQDVFSDSEEVQELLDDGGSFYDLYALNEETLQQINVILGKMTMAEQIAVKASGIKAVMEEAVNQVGDVLAGTPMEGAQITLKNTTFMGEDMPYMDWYVEQQSEYGAIPTYQKQFMMTGGSYNMTITLTSYLEDTTDEMIGMFTSTK